MKHCLKSLFSLIVILISIRCSTPSKENEDRPPNILLIMADDTGYSDIGCYGIGHPSAKDSGNIGSNK